MDGGEVGTESVTFMIPSLPPSSNVLYYIDFRRRKVEMKAEVRTWKTQAKEYIPSTKLKTILSTNPSTMLSINTLFTYNWYYKNGRLKKFDTQNLLKVLCDAIAEKCGFEDSILKKGSWDSVHSESDELVQVEVKYG